MLSIGQSGDSVCLASRHTLVGIAPQRSAFQCSHTHTHGFSQAVISLHPPRHSHELGLFVCAPLGSHGPFFVGRAPPCFGNHHAGSKHEHAALTGADNESVFFAAHALARLATRCNSVSWAVWLLRVFSFASPIECRSVVVSYVLFPCVLVTFVGSSIFFRARIFICFRGSTRTSVLYSLTTYCCPASTERNSSSQLCCRNGNRDCNNNTTMRQQMQQQYVAENTTVATDIISRNCHGLAPAAPGIGAVLIYVLMDNSSHHGAISPCTGQQR